MNIRELERLDANSPRLWAARSRIKWPGLHVKSITVTMERSSGLRCMAFILKARRDIRRCGTISIETFHDLDPTLFVTVHDEVWLETSPEIERIDAETRNG